MRKITTLLLAIILIFSLNYGMKVKAALPSDNWITNDAQVTQEVYDLLTERAGFAAYISTNTVISMNPSNVSTFKIEEQNANYFIGSFHDDSTKLLVTKEGLIVSFSPKVVEHALFENNLHFQDVQKAVKIFVGPTVTESNYINFSSLDSNKAMVYYEYNGREMKIPADARVNAIGYSYANDYYFYPSYYGTILPGSLQAGATYRLENRGVDIDGIRVFNKNAGFMSIFYNSKSTISIVSSTQYRTYNLTNKFKIGSRPVIGDKVLATIDLESDLKDMKPNTTQTISGIATYTDGSKSVIDGSSITWTSSKPSIAKVTNGTIDALASGEVTIFASYNGMTALFNFLVHDYKELKIDGKQPVNKKWTITMNSLVGIKSVNRSTVMVTDSNGEEHDVRFSISGKIITVSPVFNYKSGETYTIWVRNIESSNGKVIQQQTKMDFTTR